MQEVRKSVPVYFKSDSSSVDYSTGVIKDVVIIQSGKDKYGDNFDTKFLQQIVEQGNAQGMGVKSRFGHPNMCDSTLGSYLGRYKNFRVSSNGDKPVVMADLHLDPVAKSSPKGNLYDYVVNMTKSNSDMFGNSICYIPSKKEVLLEKDEFNTDIEVPYERLKSFLASDLVDSPAATDSLFKDTNDFATAVTDFLDNHSDIYAVIEKDENILNDFINKYKKYKQQKIDMAEEKTILQKLKEMISGAGIKQKEMIDTVDGQISCEPNVAVGSVVTDATGTPLASQTINLKDGRTVTTDSAGVITEVADAKVPDTSLELAQAKESLTALQAQLKLLIDEKTATEKELKELKSTSAALILEVESKEADITEVKGLLKLQRVDLKIPATNKTFAQSLADVTAKDNDEFSAADLIARRKELKEKK